MTAKTVLRVVKIVLNGALLHNLRKYKNKNDYVENIDFSRSSQNEILIGSNDNNEILKSQNERLKNVKGLKIKPPKNLITKKEQEIVKNLEIVLSASPEFFYDDFEKNKKYYESLTVEKNQKELLEFRRKYFNEKKYNEWKQATLDFVKKEFGDKCISAIVHRDEKCEHMHIEIIPIVIDKFNKEALSCKKFYTPDWTKSLHDKYAEAVKNLGIERGTENSQAVHKSHKDYNSSKVLQTEIEENFKKDFELNEEIPKPLFKKDVSEEKIIFGIHYKKTKMTAEEVLKHFQKRENLQSKKYNALKNFKNENENLLSEVFTIKKENDELKDKVKKLTKDIEKMKPYKKLYDEERLENLRQISLVEVCKNLGFDVKKESTNSNYYRIKTKDLNLVLNMNKNQFSENDRNINGFGAINLLTDIFKKSFKEAIEILSTNFSTANVTKLILADKVATAEIIESTVQQVTEVPKKVHNQKALDKVITYLTDRGIKKEIIEDLISKNLLYADRNNNCVFVNSDLSYGFLRGTLKDKRYVSNRGKLDFIKHKIGNKNNVYLFESVIDSLAFRTLNPTAEGTFITLSGSGLINRIEELKLDSFDSINTCFDNDVQGKKFTEKVEEFLKERKIDKTIIVHTSKNKDFADDTKEKLTETKKLKFGKNI